MLKKALMSSADVSVRPALNGAGETLRSRAAESACGRSPKRRTKTRDSCKCDAARGVRATTYDSPNLAGHLKTKHL